MPPKVHHHAERRPAIRVVTHPAIAVFFPGEAARLLGLQGVDYAQLRRIYGLARTLRGLPTPPRGWARFTLTDLAAAEVIVGLIGGREALLAGRRFVFGDLEAACSALHALGFDDPLLQVPMVRSGRRILARVGIHVIEPSTGQLALATAGQMIDQFLEERLITDRTIRAAVRAERQRSRPSRRRHIVASGVSDLCEVFVR